ncbi:MAG: hypothetical protein JSW61_11680 [Candidatus Thorarchaeota archaeon]|nr:MAG: hypothetical protein JSW61_11680 [Candidatus Thorarchaeota archaeon]
MDVSFDEKTMEKLTELATEANLSVPGLIEVVMHQFANNVGARCYTGRWSKGEVDDVKGFRYCVQWPFKPGFLEAEGDKVKKWRLE